MALKSCIRERGNILWPISFAVAFICCSLIVYYTVYDYGRSHTSVIGSSTPSLKQAEKLRITECKSVCKTEDCIDIAYDVIKFMDPQLDPCEDFYEFACGKVQEIYGPEKNYSIFSSQGGLLQVTVRDVIETSEESHDPDSAAQKLKMLYDSCMDTGSLEVTDIRTMQTFLSEIGIRNWPNLDPGFSFSNPSIGQALGKLLTFKEEILFDFNDDGSQLEFDIPYHDCDNCTDEGMKKIVTTILKHAGMNQENIKIAWDSFVEMEITIQELTKNISEETESGCENARPTGIDCKMEMPQTKSFICEAADSMIRYGDLGSKFSAENVTISCSHAQYLKSLSLFLESYNHRALAHYIALKVILSNLKNMNILYRKQNDILKEKTGRHSTPMAKSRWKFCVSYIEEKMNLPLGLMYVTEMFSQEAIDEIDDMVQEYQKATSQFILVQEALPEDTKRKLIKEIENVKHLIVDVIKSIQNGTTSNVTQDRVDDAKSESVHKIAFSQRRNKYSKTHFARKIEKEKNYIIDIIKIFKNKTKINEAYETFHPRSNDFLYNTMQLTKRSFVHNFMGSPEVEKQMDRYFLGDMIFEANAANFEGIHLFFGLLLPPFHKYEHPKLFKIARLGEIIAHEIGHTVYAVLQDIKRKDNRTLLYVEENIGCRNAQYAKFELKRIGEKLKPNRTENDDFADNVAGQVAEKVVESLFQNTQEKMFALPGISISADELFYILYAQTYCATSTIGRERWLWEIDVHSPGKYRVIGVFQNSKRFSEVFRCPETAYMNPQKKCPVFY